MCNQHSFLVRPVRAPQSDTIIGYDFLDGCGYTDSHALLCALYGYTDSTEELRVLQLEGTIYNYNEDEDRILSWRLSSNFGDINEVSPEMRCAIETYLWQVYPSYDSWWDRPKDAAAFGTLLCEAWKRNKQATVQAVYDEFEEEDLEDVILFIPDPTFAAAVAEPMLVHYWNDCEDAKLLTWVRQHKTSAPYALAGREDILWRYADSIDTPGEETYYTDTVQALRYFCDQHWYDQAYMIRVLDAFERGLKFSLLVVLLRNLDALSPEQQQRAARTWLIHQDKHAAWSRYFTKNERYAAKQLEGIECV